MGKGLFDKVLAPSASWGKESPHPWPVLDVLNWTHHCAVWPEDDGSGLLLYPAAGLLASEKAAALRFAEDNLPALLRDMCLEHLPRRVRWCQCNPPSAGSRRRGRRHEPAARLP